MLYDWFYYLLYLILVHLSVLLNTTHVKKNLELWALAVSSRLANRLLTVSIFAMQMRYLHAANKKAVGELWGKR